MFSSQATSRSTLSRSRWIESTRRLRDSWFLAGSSSVSRSSSDGCRRSEGVSSAMRAAAAPSPAAAGGPSVSGHVEPDLPDIHQRILAGVGGQHPLARPEKTPGAASFQSVLRARRTSGSLLFSEPA